VAADREALRKAAEEQVERGRAATKLLAQMLVDEEQRHGEMEADIPRRLSAVTGRQPKKDEDAESFGTISSCSEDDDDDCNDKNVFGKPVVSVLPPPSRIYH